MSHSRKRAAFISSAGRMHGRSRLQADREWTVSLWLKRSERRTTTVVKVCCSSPLQSKRHQGQWHKHTHTHTRGHLLMSYHTWASTQKCNTRVKTLSFWALVFAACFGQACMKLTGEKTRSLSATSYKWRTCKVHLTRKHADSEAPAVLPF